MQQQAIEQDITHATKDRGKTVFIILLALLLIVSFFLRAYQPISRSSIWPDRAGSFLSAVQTQNWGATYQSRHPGVTTMAVGAATYAVFELVEGTPLEGLFTWGAIPHANSWGIRVAVAMVGMAVFLTLLLLVTALIARAIYGRPFALVLTAVVSFSPFFLTQSRVFHVDGPAAALMLLSALLLIGYIEKNRMSYLIGSGIVGGFAFITKSPAVFLMLYAGLAFLVVTVQSIMREWHGVETSRAVWILKKGLTGIGRPLGIWLAVFIVPVFMWPAVPHSLPTFGPIQLMFSGAAEHVEDPHANSRYFAGTTYWRERPPLTYYASSLLWRTSFITLVFLIFAILACSVWRKRKLLPTSPTVFWLMAAYVVFFTAQMAIGAKQIDRYILPAQIMLDMMAAAGIIGFGKLLSQALSARSVTNTQSLTYAALVLPVVMHIGVTLPFFPDFGARYNYLLGNSHTATYLFSFLGQNEGNHFVADYIASQPDADTILLVGRDGIWDQYDLGLVDGTPTRSLEMVSITDIRRQHLWVADLQELYKDRKPIMTVSFDNVVYLWLFDMNEKTQTPTMVIRRGWAGFTVVAWVLTLAFAGITAWAIRESSPSREEQARLTTAG